LSMNRLPREHDESSHQENLNESTDSPASSSPPVEADVSGEFDMTPPLEKMTVRPKLTPS